MTRSKDQMVEDISAGLASGKYKSLGEAVTKNIREPIQGKAEYKLRSAKRAGIDITPSLTKVWDSAYYRDQWSNQYKALWQATGNVVEQGTVQSAIQKYTSIKDGTVLERWQCGAFVNDYLATVGAGVSCADSMQSKLDMINQPATRTPTQGSVVVMGVNSEQYKENWHVAIVTGVNQDWSINIKESNYKSPNTVSSRTIKANDPLVKGFYAPNVGWQVGGGTNDIDSLVKSDPVYKMANNIINGIWALPSKNSKDYEKVINAMWEIQDKKVSQEKDEGMKAILNSAKYDKEVSDTMLKMLSDGKRTLSNLNNLQANLKTMEDDVWPIEWYLRGKNPYDVKAQGLSAQINALAPKVARWVFWEVGVLTDQDIERYMKTIPNQKMSANVWNVVGDLLKMAVYKNFTSNVVTNAQGGRNMSNFAEDYKKAKSRLDSKGVSVNPFDESQPQVQSKQIKDRAPSTSSSSSSSTSTWYSFVDPSKVWTTTKKPVYAGMSKK